MRKLDEGRCWFELEAVVVVDVGCLGVLPLRLMGLEEEEAIGRIHYRRCVLLMVPVDPRKNCICHCETGNFVSVKMVFPRSANSIDVLGVTLVLIRHLLPLF